MSFHSQFSLLSPPIDSPEHPVVVQCGMLPPPAPLLSERTVDQARVAPLSAGLTTIDCSDPDRCSIKTKRRKRSRKERAERGLCDMMVRWVPQE